MATNSGLTDEENRLLGLIQKGEMKLHGIDTIAPGSAQKIRRAFLEARLGLQLGSIGSARLTLEECDPNIENMIGAVEVPLGVAGPLLVKGDYAKGEFFIPLATTEGALVASVNRGCTVISGSGGAVSIIMSDEQSRSILFRAQTLEMARDISVWVRDNFAVLKKTAEKGERFISITGLDPYVIGLNVFIRVRADTKDAMGMNMITIAARALADLIHGQFQDAEFISESGNMCIDKKPGAINLINSRGKRVIASVDVPAELISRYLKTSPDKLIDLNYRKNLLGSAASGSLGFNAHFANMIAAIFTATGQDIAHTVDGSLGFTTVEKSGKGANFSVTLPDLQVGTVGGGTRLPAQKECLSLLGVAGPGSPPGAHSRKLAEIIAAAVLAGEISLLGALCTHDLASAHQKLNR